MKLIELLRNNDEGDRAVSPVIGVILMVAITVILAAVVGTFVLGLSDQVNETAPQASFSFEGEGGQTVTITHDGGDVIQDDLTVKYTNSTGTDQSETWPANIRVGDEHTTSNAVGNDETVRIVWTSSDGTKENVIGDYTAPG